jgi:hypothetical protein
MFARGRVKAIVEAYGYAMTYKDVSASSRSGTGGLTRANTTAEYAFIGHIRRYKPEELSQNLLEFGDRELRIAAESISFTPRVNDFVEHRGKDYRVVAVDTRGSDAEGDIMHIVSLRG